MVTEMGKFPADTRGFSLVELMLVLVIMAILVTVALPTYRGHVISTQRSLGWAALLTAMARQEQYFINYRQYASSLDALGYGEGPHAIGSRGNIVPADSPDRVFLLGISNTEPELAPMTFTLTATPQLGQRQDRRCGVLSLHSTGSKTTSAGSVEECW
jgi:type IV pilus assembly protein PilE